MATKGNNVGLLSRVARFVLHPTRDWSAQDQPEPEPESGYSKQALKEMIERKRQNDFIRRREFDHLRKLRRNVPAISPDLTDRPSVFQNSMSSNPDERATTLKKIDEIEAQMSRQWWKGKQDEAALQGSNPDTAGANTFVTTRAPASSLTGELLPDTVYEATQMGLVAPQDAPPTAAVAPRLAAGGAASVSAGAGSRFSSSQLFSIELGESLADPDLEEAAIRFANGDDAGAEAVLLGALQADQVEPASASGWAAALFDLYRATGQQASFDRVALDYARRFGCSAPGWFSTPELLGRTAPALAAAPVAVPAPSRTLWQCPAELDLPALQALRASLAHAPLPWRLNWSRLQAITPDAAKALAPLFAQWCAQAVELHFDGAEALEKTLRNGTPSGQRQLDPCWWQLRLDALRILRLPEEFELAALDYCVTYEVSPPPWEDARCHYVAARGAASKPAEHGLASAAAPGPQAEPSHASAVRRRPGPVPEVELSGEVLGDAAEALNKFQAGLKGADRLVVSCARLIRVDFSAAGSILNWVAAREAAGCQVQFHDVPRLVAAFFSVIGINQHARVMLRTT